MVRTLTIVWILASLAGACSRGPEPRQYPLTGQVIALAPERSEITIRHQDIPNFMPGMTMPFTVREADLLDGLQPGDLVTATLLVGETSAYLSEITRTGHTPLEEAPAPDGTTFLRPGDPVADAPFVDQAGAPRPLASFRGHRVALTFVYTRCPIPDFCPLMNRHFTAVQQAVRSRPELADVRLVTVTLDPAFDTPPVLQAHARVWNADPAIWSFLTGEPAAVLAFGEQFGIYNEPDPDDPSQITHNLRTAVLDGNGRLVRVQSGNEWTPADLLADLTATAASGD